MKIVVVVIDGAADGITYRPTSFELAKTPGLDILAKNAVAGCFYPIDDKTPPESDAAVFSILGYNPEEISVGRGILEALGVGLRIKEGCEIAFRANFATVDPKSMKIIDRRVGRSLSTEEAGELAKAIDGVELGAYGGYAKVVATIGHRAVVVIGSRERKLSANVTNTDPAYERKGKLSVAVKSYTPYISMCKPLDDSEEAKVTCELVNEFIHKVVEVLDSHRINIERDGRGLPKANAVLLRDAEDRIPSITPIRNLYARSFGIVAEMPVEIGIGALLGMDVAKVSLQGSKNILYRERVEATLRLLEKNDVVYVHLKGPDEPGHDGNKLSKVEAIETIDELYIQPLIKSVDLESTAIIVTSDHCTPPELKAHSSDAVPIMVSYKRLKQLDNIVRFTEPECCSKGSLGIISKGYLVLSKVFSLLK
ncbi:MAG: alkaline phosphatase family protein [Ignisphaera sp.]|uniref:2,3-bisphosphoglycerate-independent phosphoglycerate mutase n=1 Tax=Ignisphaera aggregans TaxID=334771 RepID=A0A7C4NKN7_9CREN